MQDKMMQYLNDRINQTRQMQAKLRQDCREDEAAHQQIALNVYAIFRSTYQALKFDLDAAVTKFSSIAGVWAENRRRAAEHNDDSKVFIEEIKLSRARAILERAQELEAMPRD